MSSWGAMSSDMHYWPVGAKCVSKHIQHLPNNIWQEYVLLRLWGSNLLGDLFIGKAHVRSLYTKLSRAGGTISDSRQLQLEDDLQVQVIFWLRTEIENLVQKACNASIGWLRSARAQGLNSARMRITTTKQMVQCSTPLRSGHISITACHLEAPVSFLPQKVKGKALRSSIKSPISVSFSPWTSPHLADFFWKPLFSVSFGA